MTTLFYLLGYLGVIGFAVTSFLKIKKYVKTTPLHCRWEIYPIPHEGARAKHGGSYMEESNWWTKEHHVDHMGDLKALLMEVLFLESTFHNNRTLWYRTYPFHFGLYMLMGGAIILFITAFLRLFGMSADKWMNWVLKQWEVTAERTAELDNGSCCAFYTWVADDGRSLFTCVAVQYADDAYWVTQLTCPADLREKYEPQLTQWAQSIRITAE